MTESTTMNTSDITVYAKWNKPATTYTYATPCSKAIDVTGYDTITVTVQTCGGDVTGGQFAANVYTYSARIGTSENAGNLGTGYSATANTGASTSANVSNYSTVYIYGGAGGYNTSNGAQWSCSNCRVIVTLQ